jgi:outer membrane protein assembly factor BamB
MQTNELTARKPLRLWPGVIIAIVVALFRYVIPLVAPDAALFSFPLAMLGVLVGMLGAVAIALWWLFLSRAYWSERLGAIVLMIVAVFATSGVVHESIAGGMMGMMLFAYSLPLLGVAFVAWAVVTRRLSNTARRATLVVAILLACVPWTLVRTAGLSGGGSEFHWRWTLTAEQRLLAQASDESLDSARGGPKAVPPSTAPAEIPKEPLADNTGDKPLDSDRDRPLDSARSGPLDSARDKPVARPATPATAKTEPAARAATETPAEWPGFRGPNRDSVIRGVRINTDWSTSPPVEMWRRPIGPGWSSFAVNGDLLYTQEQRGDDEIVASHKVSTGEPVWRHRDPARFWESNGGAGPRATPTLSNGRVYTFGATGIVNALNAATGSVVWSRSAASDTGRKVPDWGFASSPLVVDDVVIVAVSGTLAAYDLATGHPRWFGPAHGGSYSSPHLLKIDGVSQILLLSGAGATSVEPANGTLLWEHAWPGGPIVQPALTANGDVLISTAVSTGGVGTRRIAAAQGPGGWSIEERWTSNGLKPYFNDFVVHKGHAFGFDGNILACIDLEDGKRKWKGGRYGNGQLVLLPEQDVLLVLSEEGELALVGATTDQFRELARFSALEGKTWNHPVLVRDVLLVRNGQEMAAFRLTLAGP